MANIGVFYATRHGQTAKIAEHIAAGIRAQGHTVEVLRCPRRGEPPCGPARFDTVILGSSVHRGRHEPEIERFIPAHQLFLEHSPSAFFSVSLSAQGAPPKGPQAARECVDKTIARTGWSPHRIALFAGALPYTRYNWLVRFVMKRIARAHGGDTDTTRDYEYTDWKAVDAFANAVAHDVTERFPWRANYTAPAV
jgi:menaquinone-dependent protoporphyrinogen oxidase